MSGTIEMKARDYCNSTDISNELCDQLNSDTIAETERLEISAYIAGYNQCEKDMREKAGEGFDEFFIKYNYENGNYSERHEDYYSRKYHLTRGWEAATLSADKRHTQEIIKLKDKISLEEMAFSEAENEITRLQAQLDEAREAMEMGAFHHGGCRANWYESDGVNVKKCTCAREKVTSFLAKYPDRATGAKE